MFKRILAALAAAALLVAAPVALAAENTITVATISQSGTTQALAAANTDGSQFLVRSGGRTFLLVDNASGGSINVTLEVQTTSINVPGAGAITVADIVVAVPSGAAKLIGPIAPAYVDASGYAHITYSAVTSVTTQAYYLPGVN